MGRHHKSFIGDQTFIYTRSLVADQSSNAIQNEALELKNRLKSNLHQI